MSIKLRSRLSYANVMSSLAFFLALGGGAAWAANEFTGANIQDGTLTGADVANDSLHAADLAPGAVATGELRNGSATKAKLAPPEPWRAASLAGANVSGGGSWVNRAGGPPAGFYKDPQGVVHLRGYVCGKPTSSPYCTSGTVGFDSVFVLPAGYRPTHELRFATVSRNAFGRIYIEPDGYVWAGPADYDSVALDGIEFRACGEPNAGAC